MSWLSIAGSPVVAAAFSPTDIATLELWLNAKTIIGKNDGDPVNTWADDSGNSRTATKSATAPIYKINQRLGVNPAILLNSAGAAYFTLTDFLTGAGFTSGEAFVVAKSNATVNTGPLMGSFCKGTTEFSHWPFPGGDVYDGFGSTARKTVGAMANMTSFGVYNVRSAASAWSAWWNGVEEHTTGTNTASFETSDSGARVPLIGADFGGGILCECTIEQVLFFSGVLSAGDRADIMTFLET